MDNKLYTYLFYYFIASSLLRFVAVLLSSIQSPRELGEKRVRWVANYGSITDIFHFVVAFIFLNQDIRFMIPNFMFSGVNFEVNWTFLSIIFLGFAIIIISLINRFSIIYLHRDTYYYKFFSIIYILQVSLYLLILTDGSESIFIGWELLGLSSILLIAFYEYRISVLKNSLIILVIYKVADILLYSALIYSSAHDIRHFSMITEPRVIIVLLLACLIKSSIFPWFWLPRAMEGPTQSTAIFYGGLATHIPVFIFINVWWGQHFQSTNVLMMVMVCLIVSSIIGSSLLSKRMNDAKNSIAYSAIAQLGIIYLEVIFGYFHLAVMHCIIHGIYRTVEFLKAPSLLYSRHSIEKDRKSISTVLDSIRKKIFYKPIRIWLYKVCYHEFFIPRVFVNLIENFIGLYSSRVIKKTIKSYTFYSLIAIIIVAAVTVYILNYKISMQDGMLFIIAYILNLFAFSNKYDPKLFFLLMTSSIFITLTVLAEKIFPILIYSLWIYVPVLAYGLYLAYRKNSNIDYLLLDQNIKNFTGRIYKSTTMNMLILFLGLSNIGIPGFGIFFIWGHIEHALLHIYPGLIINAYVLLSLNTILFFRFYYSNYLGKQEVLNQFYASYRD